MPMGSVRRHHSLVSWANGPVVQIVSGGAIGAQTWARPGVPIDTCTLPERKRRYSGRRASAADGVSPNDAWYTPAKRPSCQKP
jgi:hypothetical protein